MLLITNKKHEKILEANNQRFNEILEKKEMECTRAWLYFNSFKDSMYDLAIDFDKRGYSEAASMLREKIQML